MKLYLVEIDDPSDGYTEGPRFRTVAVCTSEAAAHDILEQYKVKHGGSRFNHNIEPIESDSYPMVQ